MNSDELEELKKLKQKIQDAVAHKNCMVYYLQILKR